MNEPIMNIEKIIKMLPHRYPFLLVDRVLSINHEEESLVALKNVTFNEPHFTGHFPDRPVMPGVLIVEALAQAAALYVIDSMKLSHYLSFFFRSSLVKRFLISRIKKRPSGPTAEIREKAQTLVWGEAKNPFGVSKSTILELPEGYTLTAWTAVKIAQNILNQEPPHGSHTPAGVYGKDFIMQFDKVKRRDLD